VDRVEFLLACGQGVGHWDGGALRWLRRGNCYGLTWSEDELFYTRNQKHDPRSVVESWNGEPVPLSPINAHDILWAKSKLWVTDTGRDQVLWWDGEKVGEVAISPRGRDTLHVNSLWEWDGEVVVLESGLSGAHRGRGPKLRTLRAKQYLLEVGDLFCHNFVAVGDWLYGCWKEPEGIRSGMYRKALPDGPLDKVAMPPGSFMRGLATDGKVMLWGRSEERPRPERPDGPSSVVVTDLELKQLGEVYMEDTGQICTVRLLADDLAHNGLPLP
jgi:hypothetical protein